MDCFLVWGNPKEPSRRRVYRRSVGTSEVSVDLEGQMASLEIGPVPLIGPIIHSLPRLVHPADAEELVVLIDADIPEWIAPDFMAAFGWAPSDFLPRPSRYPMQADVLLLSHNWAGGFAGWSSFRWTDPTVRPMQRTIMPISLNNGDKGLLVHILETGVDAHHAPFIVAYVPDQDALDREFLERNGWRREPVARLRRQAWEELANLSEVVEVEAVSVLGATVISHAVLHDSTAVNQETLVHLPDDVRSVIEVALEECQGDNLGL